VGDILPEKMEIAVPFGEGEATDAGRAKHVELFEEGFRKRMEKRMETGRAALIDKGEDPAHFCRKVAHVIKGARPSDKLIMDRRQMLPDLG
jgi:hypothetical protein